MAAAPDGEVSMAAGVGVGGGDGGERGVDRGGWRHRWRRRRKDTSGAALVTTTKGRGGGDRGEV